MKNTKEFSYDVVKHLGNFGEKENYTKEVNIIKWGGRPTVFDIRAWHIGKENIKFPLKGMSLKKEEIKALRDLLNSIDIDSLGV